MSFLGTTYGKLVAIMFALKLKGIIIQNVCMYIKYVFTTNDLLYSTLLYLDNHYFLPGYTDAQHCGNRSDAR